MIQVDRVSKQFALNLQQRRELQTSQHSLFAVNEVSFQCHPGRIYSLLGPNGAGKTTMLRMISTLLHPSAGRIQVSGFDSAEQAHEVRRRIGFLTGSTNLYDKLTPLETIRYFAELYQLPESVWKPRSERLIEQLGIGDFRAKRIGQLSTGMKQKVSIARSMIHDPEVVIFDEPSSGLDVITANNIIELVRNCKKEGKTVLFSSHIMSEVDLLADELGIIHKGRLVYAGSMDDFRKLSEGRSLTETFIQVVQKA
jgi:sodium transport system ATP-binding protein